MDLEGLPWIPGTLGYLASRAEYTIYNLTLPFFLFDSMLLKLSGTFWDSGRPNFNTIYLYPGKNLNKYNESMDCDIPKVTVYPPLVQNCSITFFLFVSITKVIFEEHLQQWHHNTWN